MLTESVKWLICYVVFKHNKLQGELSIVGTK